MTMISSSYGDLPGEQASQTTYEQAFSWGGSNKGIIKGEIIAAASVDAGASPTYRLRPGLVLGRIAASGKMTDYLATATDGSAIAVAVLLTSLRMQDVLSGSTQDKFYGVLVAGPVQAGRLYGLDSKARSDMWPRFIFDDDLWGVHSLYKMESVQTANYTVTTGDNGTWFKTNGSGAIVFSLPAIAPGLRYRFTNEVNQNMTVASTTNNVIATNNLAATNVAFSSANGLIGGGLEFIANQGGTKWNVLNISSGSNTITLS